MEIKFSQCNGSFGVLGARLRQPLKPLGTILPWLTARGFSEALMTRRFQAPASRAVYAWRFVEIPRRGLAHRNHSASVTKVSHAMWQARPLAPNFVSHVKSAFCFSNFFAHFFFVCHKFYRPCDKHSEKSFTTKDSTIAVLLNWHISMWILIITGSYPVKNLLKFHILRAVWIWQGIPHSSQLEQNADLAKMPRFWWTRVPVSSNYRLKYNRLQPLPNPVNGQFERPINRLRKSSELQQLMEGLQALGVSGWL